MPDWTLGQGLGALGAAMTPKHTYYYHTTDPATRLCCAHYSDPHFDGEGAIIFGAVVDGLEWIEGETLPYPNETQRLALELVYGQTDTAQRREARLRAVLGDPTICLHCIITRTDPQDGYARNRYGITRGTRDRNPR